MIYKTNTSEQEKTNKFKDNNPRESTRNRYSCRDTFIGKLKNPKKQKDIIYMQTIYQVNKEK